MNNRCSKSGLFRAITLIEVLILVCLVMLFSLIGLLFVPKKVHPKECANRTKCMNNLRQMGMALSKYETEYGVSCPWGPMGRVQTDPKKRSSYVGGLYDEGKGILGDEFIFECPSGSEFDGRETCQYLRSWWDVRTLKPNVVIAGDYQSTAAGGSGNHGREYSNFLFKDGHAIGFTFDCSPSSPLAATDIPGAADATDDMYNTVGDTPANSDTRTALIYNDG